MLTRPRVPCDPQRAASFAAERMQGYLTRSKGFKAKDLLSALHQAFHDCETEFLQIAGRVRGDAPRSLTQAPPAPELPAPPPSALPPVTHLPPRCAWLPSRRGCETARQLSSR